MYKGIGVVGLIIVTNLAFVLLGGASWLEERLMSEPEPALLNDPVLVDVFNFTLEEEVRKKRGLPEEGYQPQMFLDVFPGLAATDFEGVAASGGHYTFKNGALELELDTSALVPETPGGISRQGMETLLQNIATRTNIDLTTTGTITDVIRVITGA